MLTARRGAGGAFGAASVCAVRLRRSLCARAPQPFDLLVKRLNVLEVTVHGGEAHVGDLVEMAQLLHDQLADGARRYLAIAEAAHAVHDAAYRLVDVFARHRALLQRLLHAGAQLHLIERLAAAITLDY